MKILNDPTLSYRKTINKHTWDDIIVDKSSVKTPLPKYFDMTINNIQYIGMRLVYETSNTLEFSVEHIKVLSG